MMAFEKGRAGKSARELQNRRYKARGLVILMGSLLVLALLVIIPTVIGKLGIVGVIVLAIIMLRIMRVTDRATERIEKLEKRACAVAKAEEIIGELLKELPGDYAVFHDIKSPYGNIDHVVIDKGNRVFLIETKSHRGEVTYTGNRLLVDQRRPEKDFIYQALKNAYWLREEIKKQASLDIFIKPIVVFARAFVKISGPIKNVSVINKKYLLPTIYGNAEHTRQIEGKTAAPSLFIVLRRLQNPSRDTE